DLHQQRRDAAPFHARVDLLGELGELLEEARVGAVLALQAGEAGLQIAQDGDVRLGAAAGGTDGAAARAAREPSQEDRSKSGAGPAPGRNPLEGAQSLVQEVHAGVDTSSGPAPDPRRDSSRRAGMPAQT